MDISLGLRPRNCDRKEISVIAAISMPVAHAILDQQSMSDLADLGTYQAASNYTSSVGDIVSVETVFRRNGMLAAADDVMTHGDLWEICFVVSDVQSAIRIFKISGMVQPIAPVIWSLADNGDGSFELLSSVPGALAPSLSNPQPSLIQIGT